LLIELLLGACCRSCGNDPRYDAPFNVDHEEHAPTFRIADQPDAVLLANGHIFRYAGEQIEERLRCLFERDAVLVDVLNGLPIVPFEEQPLQPV
jgi:hypothetical protein